MIDEIDVLQTDNNFRPQLENVIDYYLMFPLKNRCMVTATMKEFINPLLKKECKFSITWIYNARRDVKLLHTNNTTQTVIEEIISHPRDKIFIAYNSILQIQNILSTLDEETRKECAILCSEASIKEAGEYFAPKLGDNDTLPARINLKKLLLVEDNQEFRTFLKEQLEDFYQIIEAADGEEGERKAIEENPNLIISDIMMPEMDGLTLCRKIKQNVNLNHIPVILLTAKTREEDNLEGLNTGADAYIMKPFNIEILQKTVENLINTRQQLRKVFTGQQNLENKVQKLEVKSPDEKLMERIMKVINENIGNPNLTIETITTEVGISRVHLHRKLKELTNQTTRDFIRNIRLKEAARLLSEKQHTISEIAMLTGFTDPNNFSTTFKELYGMPPSMYMKEQLSKKEE